MTSILLGPQLVVVCLAMVAVAAAVYLTARIGPAWVVPVAAVRAAAQLAAVSAVLAAAMARVSTSLVVLTVMFTVAVWTAARRSQASTGSLWLAVPMLVGLTMTVPPMLLTGLIPPTGIALVPIVGIVLGGTMTSVAVAARLALTMLDVRAGEVEAALSLGFSARDARMEIIHLTAAEALLPNVDQARTSGLVVLPGAFVGVLLSTGSAAQAGAVQVLVIVALLTSQSCAVALTCELVARNRIARTTTDVGPG